MAALADNAEFSGEVVRLKSGQNAPDGMDVFNVMRDGKVEKYAAPSEVVDAMKGMNAQQADIATRMAAVSSRTLRAGAQV